MPLVQRYRVMPMWLHSTGCSLVGTCILHQPLRVGQINSQRIWQLQTMLFLSSEVCSHTNITFHQLSYVWSLQESLMLWTQQKSLQGEKVLDFLRIYNRSLLRWLAEIPGIHSCMIWVISGHVTSTHKSPEAKTVTIHFASLFQVHRSKEFSFLFSYEELRVTFVFIKKVCLWLYWIWRLDGKWELHPCFAELKRECRAVEPPSINVFLVHFYNQKDKTFSLNRCWEWCNVFIFSTVKSYYMILIKCLTQQVFS